MKKRFNSACPGPRSIVGVTLIELMVAMAISIFLIGGIVLMFGSSRAASVESERLSRVQENIRFTSDYLVRELRNAGFRDQLSLTVSDFDLIGQAFAEVSEDGDELTIRFSGSGSCAEPFQTTNLGRIIQNTYFVDDDDGELRCTGTVAGGGTRTVSLARGIHSIAFEAICPDINPGCECRIWAHGQQFADEEDSLNNSCHGMRIQMEFADPGNEDTLTVNLRASFRNIILGRMMWASIPPAST